MSVEELKNLVGKTGLLRIKAFTKNSPDFMDVKVVIADVTDHWGRLRYKVHPTEGQGGFWVNADRVTLDK